MKLEIDFFGPERLRLDTIPPIYLCRYGVVTYVYASMHLCICNKNNYNYA